MTQPATDTNTDPNNTGDNSAGGLGNVISSAVGGAASTLITPFSGWFNQIEADVLNVWNQIFNTIFYFGILVFGVFFMMWGFYLLFKDTAPVQGAKAVAGVLAK